MEVAATTTSTKMKVKIHQLKILDVKSDTEGTEGKKEVCYMLKTLGMPC